jgi:hypothetical protein
MLAIKEDVDRERAPGRYLLTGSASALTAAGWSGVLLSPENYLNRLSLGRY